MNSQNHKITIQNSKIKKNAQIITVFLIFPTKSLEFHLVPLPLLVRKHLTQAERSPVFISLGFKIQYYMLCMTHPLYSTVPEELELHRCQTTFAFLRETGLLSPEINKNSQIHKESGYKDSHGTLFSCIHIQEPSSDKHTCTSINTLTTFTSHVTSRTAEP